MNQLVQVEQSFEGIHPGHIFLALLVDYHTWRESDWMGVPVYEVERVVRQALENPGKNREVCPCPAEQELPDLREFLECLYDAVPEILGAKLKDVIIDTRNKHVAMAQGAVFEEQCPFLLKAVHFSPHPKQQNTWACNQPRSKSGAVGAADRDFAKSVAA